MTRRPPPDPPAADNSAPLNLRIGADGSVVQPDALTVVNRVIDTPDIFAGLYLGNFALAPVLVKPAGASAVVELEAASSWTCSAAGSGQFRYTIQSPLGVNVLQIDTGLELYAAGTTLNPIAFAAATVASNASIPAGNWAFVAQRVAGTGTFLPGILGLGFGNLVVKTLG